MREGSCMTTSFRSDQHRDDTEPIVEITQDLHERERLGEAIARAQQEVLDLGARVAAVAEDAQRARARADRELDSVRKYAIEDLMKMLLPAIECPVLFVHDSL